MTEKIVVFGAGATGRGHVGLLAWQAGYQIVFVDSKQDLVDELAQAGRYTVTLCGDCPQRITVDGYRVYHHLERDAISAEIRDAELVLTAVFDQNLPDVAQTIAVALAACRKAGRTKPLNCIACENMMDSSSTLGRHVQALLGDEDVWWYQRYAGFPDCMISRVVPRPVPDPLTMIAENYNEWTVRADFFRGEKPPHLTAMELVDNQTARLERKLFLHNGGHAICGYMGFHRGHQFIHEAVGDPIVAEHVLGALDELGDVVRHKHGFSAESIAAYKHDLVVRGSVPEMKDAILRVVRDPLRKLSHRERLVAPAQLALEYHLPRQWIVKGIVAALKYHHSADSQSVELADMLSRDNLRGVLERISAIDRNSPLADEIETVWNNWSW